MASTTPKTLVSVQERSPPSVTELVRAICAREVHEDVSHFINQAMYIDLYCTPTCRWSCLPGPFTYKGQSKDASQHLLSDHTRLTSIQRKASSVRTISACSRDRLADNMGGNIPQKQLTISITLLPIT